MKAKKFSIFAVAMLVLAMSFCFASGEGLDGFISSIDTGLSMSAIWGAISPIAPLMITLTLVAITRYVLNKNLGKAPKGRGARV